jgi:manganese/zinc/iron transport system permease protein
MMMDSLLRFLSLADANTRMVVLGTVLLTGSSALVGSFSFLRKRALVGDAVAHAVLPGVCLAFLIQGEKNPAVLLVGAFVTGWLALVAIDFIKQRSIVKEDAAIGIVLSVFFGVGILLLTAIQHGANAGQSGLDKFLFGKAAAITWADLQAFGLVALLLVVVTALLFKEFSLLSFDIDFARAMGFPVRALELVLTSLSVLAVVVGIQAVGVVLMAAMLITPAAAARYWTNRLHIFVLLAVAFGIVGGVTGAWISYAAPGMPTGPWMVLAVSAIALGSIAFAPRSGIVAKLLQQRANRRRILEENLLKALYQLGEADGNPGAPRNLDEIFFQRQLVPARMAPALYRLRRKGLVTHTAKPAAKGWQLTPSGTARGKHIVKLHRLWEAYLASELRIAPDHVHEDAETIEHLLTPELEQQLEQLLNKPRQDPHHKPIPY